MSESLKELGGGAPLSPRNYYRNQRVEVVDFFDGPCESLLDVGGGEGLTSIFLKNAGLAKRIHLWDYDEQAVQSALQSKEFESADRVDLNNPETLPSGCFDVVLLLDVLEHLVDPWAALKALRSVIAPGGRIIISLPNVNDITAVAPLMLKGRWDYTPDGVLDRTHLRFFTFHSMIEMINGAGFRVESSQATRPGPRKVLNALSIGIFERFFSKQYLFSCEPLSWCCNDPVNSFSGDTVV